MTFQTHIIKTTKFPYLSHCTWNSTIHLSVCPYISNLSGLRILQREIIMSWAVGTQLSNVPSRAIIYSDHSILFAQQALLLTLLYFCNYLIIILSKFFFSSCDINGHFLTFFVLLLVYGNRESVVCSFSHFEKDFCRDKYQPDENKNQFFCFDLNFHSSSSVLLINKDFY